MPFLSFSAKSHIEFLCARALWRDAVLGPSVMMLARLENDRSRFKLVPRPRSEPVARKERISDTWPDWSTEIGAAELAREIEKNRPSIVLREAAGAVIYGVGLVILLMAILSASHIG